MPAVVGRHLLGESHGPNANSSCLDQIVPRYQHGAKRRERRRGANVLQRRVQSAVAGHTDIRWQHGVRAVVAARKEQRHEERGCDPLHRGS